MDPNDAPIRALSRLKAGLRERLLAARRALDPGEIERAGTQAAGFVAEAREFVRAGTLILYAATPDEMPTRPLFERALQAGKRTLFPRCLPEGRLEFVLVEDWEQLAPGRYGLLEPEPGLPCGSFGVEDLAIVPGVAFDRAGHRLGRGQGYYDRAFPAGGSAPALFGYAFELQIRESVPVGPLDRRMDAVVSERGLVGPPSLGGR